LNALPAAEGLDWRRGLTLGLIWSGACAVVLGAILAMPSIRREYFWNWWGSQRVVIDRLASQQRWQAAQARVQRLQEDRPWDPRLADRHAQLLSQQVASAGRDPTLSADVRAAFAEACHGYFYTSTYPYLMSPKWTNQMATAFLQWGACASAQRDWPLVAFCLEYASELDPSRAPAILRSLESRLDRREQLPPEVLATAVHVALECETPDDALELLGRVTPSLDPEAALLLRTECEHARARQTGRGSVEVTRLAAIASYHPNNLAISLLLRQWEQEAGRSRPIYDASKLVEVASHGGLRALTLPQDVVQTEQPRSIYAPPLPQGAAIPRIPSPEHTVARGWELHSDQQVLFSWPQGLPTAETVWLVARGTAALGVWPVLEVTLNEEAPQLISIPSNLWMAVPLRVPGQVLRSLRIHFANDGGLLLLTPGGERAGVLQDRNVEVLGLWGLPAEQGQEVGQTNSAVGEGRG
jgi:hypothetical protein